ncbi:unnamed protein product [Didymodactylos carnosus]|uniref:NADP-dependent oxidoreductase domain-containing protein n=1 Tax=Didymodactylos carnosus TaxID=1234261 RepID=A0A815KIT4_9BILA|nr:unnamed protein product [Didymodactylos carnosus]CAF1393736.1 unnamed protein product [Didymodactylos carnosus]CAF3674512.1 unnamed protein product [Didymodactylos carnosus]CAF4287982.1 unnamed protein product [Didymodactylos carnosus]
MQYQKVGNTDIEVSRVILGCRNSGGIGSVPSLSGEGENEEQVHGILNAAVHLGITTFDTADGYGDGRSETYIGNWLRNYQKKEYQKKIDGTLECLGIKQLDMYLSHERNDETPLEETLSCFNELQKSEKVCAYGVSNINCKQLEKSISICDDLDLSRYEWVQNSMSLLNLQKQKKRLSNNRSNYWTL